LGSKASGNMLDNGGGYQSSGPSHRKPWLHRWLLALCTDRDLAFATMHEQSNRRHQSNEVSRVSEHCGVTKGVSRTTVFVVISSTVQVKGFS
jgi:hypothetical protein